MADKQTIVITGASDGIGAASARQLAARGEQVVLVGRSPEKTAAVARELAAAYFVVDFGDLDQVRTLAADLLAAYPAIDVLANNAGGVFTQQATKDGFDQTFQVNHLAPYLLTNLLIDRLASSQAKVIQTSSVGAKAFGHLDIDDLNNTRKWNANKAYGDAKLANILFTKELHRRYHDQGINTVAFHPGNVATSFARDTSSWIRFVYTTPLKRIVLTTPDQGGQELTWLAEGTPGTTWQPGEYYEKREIAPARKLNPQASDIVLAARLWDRSAAMTGLGPVS